VATSRSRAGATGCALAARASTRASGANFARVRNLEALLATLEVTRKPQLAKILYAHRQLCAHLGVDPPGATAAAGAAECTDGAGEPEEDDDDDDDAADADAQATQMDDDAFRLVCLLADEDEDSGGDEDEDAPEAEDGMDEDTDGCIDGDTGW